MYKKEHSLGCLSKLGKPVNHSFVAKVCVFKLIYLLNYISADFISFVHDYFMKKKSHFCPSNCNKMSYFQCHLCYEEVNKMIRKSEEETELW